MKIQRVTQENNMINVTLDGKVGILGNEQAELRIMFKEDGTFRIITNLKSEQLGDIVKSTGDLADYMRVVRVEQFGHPFED